MKIENEKYERDKRELHKVTETFGGGWIILRLP